MKKLYHPVITWFYWVLLGFSSFLNEFWAIFDFYPFELFLILALFITWFCGDYWVFSLFLNDFGPIFKKTQKKTLLVVFLTGFSAVFWSVFFRLGLFCHPWLKPPSCRGTNRASLVLVFFKQLFMLKSIIKLFRLSAGLNPKPAELNLFFII